MHDLPSRVLHAVRKHRMIRAGGRVLAAVSGGSDSVALALILRELERQSACELAGIAHLNHGLRDAAVDDQRFCEALAVQLGVPLFVEGVRVRDLAREQRRSVEDAARTARYEFFERARVSARADVIATGHTRDDQAETFLLRLLRGAGTRGLAAILPVAGRVVRPLIDVRHQELRRYLEEQRQPFCEDETNRDLDIPRNRVRHELLPYLERGFSAGVTEILAREAELARQDNDRLQNEAIDSAGLIVLRSSSGETVQLSRRLLEAPHERGWFDDSASSVDTVAIDASGLAALHPALASRLVRTALSILAPDRLVGFDHVEAVLALAAASSGSVSLPGQQALRRGACIELGRAPVPPFSNSFSVPLSIPGEVTWGAHGWIISARSVDGSTVHEAEGPPDGGLAAAVQASRVVPPLAVRSRRPGDRIKPRGLAGP